jgi:hypothetical protein
VFLFVKEQGSMSLSCVCLLSSLVLETCPGEKRAGTIYIPLNSPYRNCRQCHCIFDEDFKSKRKGEREFSVRRLKKSKEHQEEFLR